MYYSVLLQLYCLFVVTVNQWHSEGGVGSSSHRAALSRGRQKVLRAIIIDNNNATDCIQGLLQTWVSAT